MRHIAAYASQGDQFQILSSIFKGNEQVFEHSLNFKNVCLEASLLNDIEDALPENLAFFNHFDMAVQSGTGKLTEYYRSLTRGKSILLESAKSSLTKEATSILNEAVSELKKITRSKILTQVNENALQQQLQSALGVATPGGSLQQVQDFLAGADSTAKVQAATAPVDAANIKTTQDFDTALGGGEYAPGQEEGGALGFIKELFFAITEGGSFIGILHLILDILGVIGDAIFAATGIPVGAIADILNAIIYFVRAGMADNQDKRGEFILLGTISLIAGLLFGAGDILKLAKGSSKLMSKVMIETIEHGGSAGVKVLGRAPAKAAGPAAKALRFIAKNVGGVIGTAGKMLGKFFDGFLAKLVGWVPFIGKPLKGLFENLGKTFTKYSDDLLKFSDEFGKAGGELIQMELKGANAMIETALKDGGELMVDAAAKEVKVLDKAGKEIGTFPVDVLTDMNVWNKKAPGLWKSAPSPKQAANYYNAVSSSGEKLVGGFAKYMFKTTGKVFKAGVRLSFFIGKQIIKLINGKDWQESGYTREEVEYFGSAAFTDWVNQRIAKEKEESGATYLPAIVLDSSEQEVFDTITKYQNTYANLFGAPNIIPVVYDKYGKDGADESFDAFFDMVKEDNVKIDSTDDKIKHEEPIMKSESVHFKHIKPFRLV